jgi:CRISPR-associated protein Cas5 subtype I-B
MNIHAFSFIVEGDIAHFRDPLTHTFFNTFIAPPPHTILGFISACLGYNEIETEKLGEKIQLGCIVKRINGFLKDLAIVSNQKDGKNITTPRTRRFLVNASYQIFVFSYSMSLIEEMRYAVRSPKFVPYLGTSDCIAFIRFISEITNAEKSITKQIKSLINIDKLNNYSEIRSEKAFTTSIIDPKMLTVFPFYAVCPMKYQLSEYGRQPINFQRILMSVNCLMKFENAMPVYQCSGETVFPL